MASQDVRALLEDVTIEGVVPIDKELGRGAYGRVFTVKYCGLVCAAKEIHSILIEGVSPAERKVIVDNFIRECHHCSVIRHPNIVQFLGVYYSSKKSELPIMVMELMNMSLTSFVKNNQSRIPMNTKMSILHNVALGLSYLHARRPVVIHRDLSPNNVMLTDHLVAKIGDLGVAKVIQADTRQTRSRLTTAPGTVDFMPPETLEANPVYGTAVDVFSYAGIALHVFAEEWPTPCGLKRRDPVTKKLMALTEGERRQAYLDKVPEGCLLKEMFVRCLDDDPEERPPIQEVSEMIEAIKGSQVTNNQSPCRVPPPVPPRSKKGAHNFPVSERSRTIESPPVQKLSDQFEKAKVSSPVKTIESPEQKLSNQFEKAKVSSPITESPSFAEALQSDKYHIKWTSCSDFPCKLYDASVAVSSAGDLVYVTAGTAPDDYAYNDVFCYNTNTDNWTILLPPGHRFGVLHMLNDRLTIFGGTDPVTHKYHNKVTTYNSDTNSWYSHYPDMLNKRFKPGVITYNYYVIVMGGMSSPDNIHDSIELMDYHDELKWKNIIIKLPIPMLAIKPTISGDNITIVGYGHAGGRNSGHYQIAVEEILSFNQSPSTSATSNQWKIKSPAPHFNTVTVPYTYPPVIIGGNVKGVRTTDVSLYDSSKNAWKKVDLLTSARNNVGVALLNNSSIIVIGGCNGGIGVEGALAHSLSTVEIGNIVHNN